MGTEEPVVSGMEELVTALKTGLTADAFFGSLSGYSDLIVTLVLVAFSIYIFSHVIKGASHGKARI